VSDAMTEQQVAPSPPPSSLVELVPRLTAEELEHYEWLISGLLDGARRLVAHAEPETVPAVLDEALDLFDELVARIDIAVVSG
jgi:hypothetical protein